MRYQIKDANGEWIDGVPTINGQHYRLFDAGGGIVESYWYVPEPEETN